MTTAAAGIATLLTLAGVAAPNPPAKDPQVEASIPAPAPDAPAARPAPEAEVSHERVIADLRAIPAKRAARGGPDHHTGLRATEELILERLNELGYQPTTMDLKWALPARRFGDEQNEAQAPPVWRNIIVEIPGAELPGEVLVIGAHFDAVPTTPGADDNATGTAALLELARVLKDRPMKRTVRLVFFNLEEVGLIGAYAYAARLVQEDITLVGMVSLEMLGYFSDEPGSQKSPIPPIKGVFEPPTVGDNIVIATTRLASPFARQLETAMRAAEPQLKIFVADFVPDPPLTPIDFLRSDHAPFLMLRKPAVMLTDTSNFRNPNYHQPTDTVDTLDLDRYTLVVRAAAGAVWRIAEPIEGEHP